MGNTTSKTLDLTRNQKKQLDERIERIVTKLLSERLKSDPFVFRENHLRRFMESKMSGIRHWPNSKSFGDNGQYRFYTKGTQRNRKGRPIIALHLRVMLSGTHTFKQILNEGCDGVNGWGCSEIKCTDYATLDFRQDDKNGDIVLEFKNGTGEILYEYRLKHPLMTLLMFQKVEREHGITCFLTPKLKQLLKVLATAAFNGTQPKGELHLLGQEEKHDPSFPKPSAPPQLMQMEGVSDMSINPAGEGEANNIRRLMGSTTDCLPIFSLLMLCLILFYGMRRCIKRSHTPLLPRWEPSDHG